MPKIKFSRVVSCSSEDPVHNSENLLNVDAKKKFLSKTKGEPSVSVILQFEKSCRISGVDIANANSAFVEIFAGRSSSKDEHYEIILPMCSFMTPMDAATMTNNNRVRLFTAEDLVATTAIQEKWDRVKIICTQPFNKNVQYGLTFIALTTKDEDIADFGRFKVRPVSPVSLKTASLTSQRKTQDAMTIAREIRTATVPECAKICIKPGSSKKIDVTESELKKQMNRNNRRDLFYDSDDDKNSGKVDKVVAHIKQDQEKNGAKKQTNSKQMNDTNKKQTNKIQTNEKQTNETNKKPINEKQNGAGPSVKRTSTTTEKIVKKRRKTMEKPFNELLSDVIFTISGFVNPERGDIRQKGLNMGAKYRKDWDNSCTHLICAFANTPKFQQVRGKGKIIKKEWFYDCNTQRRRLPWRRYALDKNDLNQPESEDEICEKTNDDVEPDTLGRSDYLSGSDTDEEIQKIINLQKNNKKDEAFDVDTDEEHLEKNAKNISDVPKLFNKDIFYIDSVFSEKETEKLERLIKSFDGAIMQRISSIIDFVVTDAESVENIRNQIFGAKFVTKEWIFECHEHMAFVPYEKYVIN